MGLLLLGGVVLAGWIVARVVRERFSFAGKSVLITGGSRGLGLVIARQICAEGGRVALLARDARELHRARDELSKEGGEAITIVCDLLDRGQAEAAIEEVIDRFGGVDVLINNAGIIEVGPLSHMKREDFEKSMNLHFWAPFTLIWKVVPHMRRRGGGRIVNISSIGGKMAVPHLAPYCASKFALVGLSDSMRAELALDDILVTTVTPGLMRTGSHVNARFKGHHAAEYTWFSVSASFPLGSIDAEHAAKRIVEACRQGQPALIIPLAARVGITSNALFPNLTGRVMKLVNRLLPRATDSSGDELRSGWQSRASLSERGWLRRFTDRAAERNNESSSDAR
ncbi:MAG: SDR family oxidoreductase [Verrucomicrobiota bacterium]|nr:SDR family oxidoreductase [Verrucomicrobiota bacterium]